MTSVISDAKDQNVALSIPTILSSLPKEARLIILNLHKLIKKRDLYNQDLNRLLADREAEMCELQKRNGELERDNIELCEKYMNLMKIKAVNFQLSLVTDSKYKDESDDIESDGACFAEQQALINRLDDVVLPYEFKKGISQDKEKSSLSNNSLTNLLPSVELENVKSENNNRLILENKKLREVIKGILARKKISLNDYLKENYFENVISSYKRTVSELEFKLDELKKLFDEKNDIKIRETLNNALHMEFCYKKLCEAEEHKIEELKKVSENLKLNHNVSENSKNMGSTVEKEVVVFTPSMDSQNIDSGYVSVQQDFALDEYKCEDGWFECPGCYQKFIPEKFVLHIKKCAFDDD